MGTHYKRLGEALLINTTMFVLVEKYKNINIFVEKKKSYLELCKPKNILSTVMLRRVMTLHVYSVQWWFTLLAGVKCPVFKYFTKV